MGKKALKTLFFIDGITPTDEQQAEADEMSGNVCFRNVIKYREEDALEDFDRLAGNVPDKYARALALKEAAAAGQPVPPLASTEAPAAPQRAAAGAGGAKPTGGAGNAWKPN